MNEKINALAKEKKNLLMMCFALIAGLIISFFVITKVRAASIVLCPAALLFYIFVYRRGINRYKAHIKAAILEEGLRSSLKNITYTEKNGVTSEEVVSAHFLPSDAPDSILSRDTVRGLYQAKPAVLTDLTANLKSSVTTGSGKTKQTLDFLTGCYFDIRLTESTAEVFTLWHKDCLTSQIREHYAPTHVELETPAALAGQFLLFVPNGFGMPKISDAFTDAVLRLEEYTPGQLCVQVSGDHLRIFIQHRFLYPYNIPTRIEITPQLLNSNPFPELRYMLQIADTLKI